MAKLRNDTEKVLADVATKNTPPTRQRASIDRLVIAFLIELAIILGLVWLLVFIVKHLWVLLYA